MTTNGDADGPVIIEDPSETWPAMETAYVDQNGEREWLKNCIEEGATVLLRGPTKTGKTLLAATCAKELERPYFDLTGHAEFRSEQLTGEWELRESENGATVTEFRTAGLAQWVQVKDAVIVLDEVNCMPAGILPMLNPLLDGRRYLRLPELGERVEVAEGVTFIVTMNEGWAYHNRTELTPDLLQRFDDVIEMEYLDKHRQKTLYQQEVDGLDDATADSLVGLSMQLREAVKNGRLSVVIAPSAFVRLGEHLVAGRDPEQAAEHAIVGKLTDAAERDVVREVVSAHFADDVDADSPEGR